MKATTTTPNTMDEKRQLLLDTCTRALCGDKTIDTKLMDEATGGRFTNGNGEAVDQEQIKTLLLALRWLGLSVTEEAKPKTRKRRTTKKAAAGNGSPVVKRRGRPKGSKNKKAEKQIEITDMSQAEAPLEAKVAAPVEQPTQIEKPVETAVDNTPPPPAQQGLDGVTFEGGSMPQ